MTFKIGEMGTALGRLAWPCWRKVRHETPDAAEAHMRQMVADGKSKRPEAANVYRCRFCGRWHVGHRREMDEWNDNQSGT